MTRPWFQPLMIAFRLAPGLMPGHAAPAAGQPVLLLEEQASFCAMFQALSPTRPARHQGRTQDHPYDPSNRRVGFVNLTDSAAHP